MLSWFIADGQNAVDYVVTRVDLKKSGDRDYINLVVPVSDAAAVHESAEL